MQYSLSRRKFNRLLAQYKIECPELTLNQLRENSESFDLQMISIRSGSQIHRIMPPEIKYPHLRKTFGCWLSEKFGFPIEEDKLIVRL